MEKLMIEYCGNYVPKTLCTIDRYGKPDDCISCGEFCETVDCECESCPMQEVFNRLALYEQLDLEPEQIKKLDEMYIEKCKEVNDLKRQLQGMGE